MERFLRFFIASCIVLCSAAVGAATRKPAMYVDPNAYAYMYPYLNNKMRTALNPGTTTTLTNNPMDVVVKTRQMAESRRVVPRSNTATARAATNVSAPATTASRRVVARAATNTTGRTVVPRAARQNATRGAGGARTGTDVAAPTTTTYDVPTTRCLAGYIECMDGYCARANTAYNRCYCSAKLAQIDSQYQDEINALMIQIIKLRGGGQWTDEEMNEYWMERIGGYVGENSWENLDNALNIEWPTAEERMRGQTVFLTGHEYCVAHLKNCASMASNMRDAYRSQISRDCNSYEQRMINIKNAATAVIEYYSE